MNEGYIKSFVSFYICPVLLFLRDGPVDVSRNEYKQLYINYISRRLNIKSFEWLCSGFASLTHPDS